MSQSNNHTYLQNHILRRFNIIKKVGSGAYGHVWKVQQKATKKILALKKIFDAFQHATDAQRTYRQIQILKQTDHPNIIKLYDTIKADNNKDVYLVFQFMQADLHNVISQNILKDVHIRFIIYQAAKALKYLHTGYIIHRDLKPSNILVNSNCTIKLCDFGLVRSISCKNDSMPILTEGVATRWYRAPQVLLGSKCYSTPADIWSFGCIIYEIVCQKPLFAGNSTLDQLQKICQFTGYPSQQDIKSIQSQVSKSMLKQIKLHNQSQSSMILKDTPPAFRDLIQRMIVFNPSKRITIDQILSHQTVKAFHKPQQQISCDKQITTSIDDNIKYSVDEYRKLIYNGASNPQRSAGQLVSSSNTIVKSHSAKYIKKPSELNSSTEISKANQKEKPQMTKKYSYDNLKVLNKSTQQHKSASMYTSSQINNNIKKQQKQTLKYVRSTKDFLKPTNYQSNKNLLYHKKLQNNQNKSTSSLSNYVQQNKQQTNITKHNYMTSSLGNKGMINGVINRPTYVGVTKNFYSSKNYLQNNNGNSMINNSINSNSSNINNKNYLQQSTKSSSAHIQSSTSTYNSNNLSQNNSNNLSQNNSSIHANTQQQPHSTMNSSWNSKSYLNMGKDMKDKAYLFKSQKYIKDFKSINNVNNQSVIKKQQEKGHI